MRPWLLALLTVTPALSARVPAGFLPGRMARLEVELQGAWDPTLAAEFGVGLALRGQCHRATAYLEGSDHPQARSALATCLSWSAQPQRAQQVREEELAHSAQSQGAHLLELAQHQRLAGDLPAAEDTLARADGVVPELPLLMALHAELALDQGQPVAAAAWLQLARDRAERLPVECLHAQARLAMGQGDLAWAEESVELARERPRGLSRTAALTARLLVLQDDPAGAVELLDRPRWREDYDPALLRARAMAFAALGAPGEAAAWWALLEAQSPGGLLDTESAL